MPDIEGINFTDQELKAWLKNEATLKMVRILKIHRKGYLDSLVNNSHKEEWALILGRCRGYDDIIELIERTTEHPEDILSILEIYRENLNKNI